MISLHCVRGLALVTCLAALAACSNGSGSLDEGQQQAPNAFTLSGTVTGLVGSGLVLQNNGGSDLSVGANGTITFPGTLADGAAYNVTVLTQPASPAQACTITNGTGQIAGANVTNIAVTCPEVPVSSFAVRGTVTGLLGTGLVLRNNGGDDLPIPADGEFSFVTAIPTGSAYAVTVATQPGTPTQTCSVANGNGTMGGADVTNVTVTCATNAFSVGGTVTGLVAGTALVLQNNSADEVTVGANGTFTFPQPVASGASYSVTVKTAPANPLQTCTIANANGMIASENVTNVMVTCATNVYTVGGTVSGLKGSGMVLRLNGGNDQAITSDGPFAFATSVTSGTPYVVTVRTQPSNPSQVCSVANATGVVVGANVTNVAITCVTNSFSIGGTVSGLAGSGLVLRKNGGDDLPIASNGSFTFTTEQASGSSYTVTVRTQPTNPSQNCTVASGTGTVGSGDVRGVRITCATNTFAIGGSVSGLLGQGLRLRNNNSDEIEVDSSGAFAFPRKLASGATYNVTVSHQPANPTQACTVTNGTGTVGAAAVNNVAISCTTSEFMIGGSVGNLAGSGLVLRNNGGDDLTINGDGPFTFATALQSGAAYNVSIAVQPTSPAQVCTLSNASGVVGGGNVTSIRVSCVTTEFSIGGSVSGLLGSGLMLQNNGTDTLQIAAAGPFTFPDSLPQGSPYNVTVVAQPANPTQICLVTNGVGTVGTGNVTNVSVTCTTIDFLVGGSVSGLGGIGLVLQNNGGDNLTILSNGSFAFPTPVPSGASYLVSVLAQPSFPQQQLCSVANGSGTVGAGDVTSVGVSCQ